MIRQITIYVFFISWVMLIFSCKKPVEYDFDLVRKRLEKTEYNSPEWWAILDGIIRKYPDQPYAYYRKGRALIQEDKLDKGLAYLEKAARLDPYTYANYFGYINLTKLENYEVAIQYFQTAIEYKNHIDLVVPGSAYERIGIAYKEMENYEKSISTFDRYIHQFGEDGVDLYTFMYRGIAKTNIGDFEGALQDFDTIIGKWEKCPEAYYRKGIIYHKKGDNSLACKQFKKALLYQNYIRGNPSGKYIDQLYVTDIEQMFDLTCE